MDFEFATAQRIVFGPGSIGRLPELAATLGRCAALVGGGRRRPVAEALEKAGIRTCTFGVEGEPTTHQVAAMAAGARAAGCDFVVAVGGGSALDAGKAVAALLTNTRAVTDYLEVVGKGEPLDHAPSPCIAIPTTAGTGAEATRNAVLLSPEHRVKVSMRHPGMLPAIALVDPALALSAPPALTASTGLDALTQLMEAFVSRKANPLTDALCRDGVARVVKALPVAYLHGDRLDARTDMALGSLFGGMALANAGLGAVHGFAGPIGGMFDAPHGMVCAALLPAVFAANTQALLLRSPTHPALGRFRELARILAGQRDADFDEAAIRLKELCESMMIPGLGDFGIGVGDIPAIVAKAKNASSMKGNPIELRDDELAAILEEALHPPVGGNSTLCM